MKLLTAAKPVSLLLCLALLAGSTVRAQQPAPQQTPQPTPRQQQPAPAQEEQEEVIRLDTDLVQLRAVVTDRGGRVVENLTKEDFEVTENGQPRAVEFFSVERAPGAAGADPQAPRAAADPSTRKSLARTPVTRTIVLFADTLHLTPLSLVRARQQLQRFVDEQVTDQDMVAVVSTGGSLGLLQQFTRDRVMLKRAIDKLTIFPGLRTSITPYLASRALMEDDEAIQSVLTILKKEEGYDSFSPEIARGYAVSKSSAVLGEKANLRRATLQTLAAVAEQMAGMRGQRLVAFVSDGFSLLEDKGNDAKDFNEAIGRAARAGVVIYALYPKGLVGPGDLTSGPVPGSQEGGVYMLESLTDYQANLRELAEATGGHAFVNTNDLRGSFQKMLDANRVYYSLAFYPPKEAEPAKKDSAPKLRRVTVRVKGHPEYNVRAQRGYLPPGAAEGETASTPQQKLVKAMVSPLPSTGIGLLSSASFLEREGDDAQVTLQVHIDADRLWFEKQGERHQLRCEIAVMVFDKQGVAAEAASETVEALLTPAQVERARRLGYRYTKRMNLKPGLYQVRVGVREVGSELTGTSVAWVEVPDLAKNRLALSSIFLGRGRDAARLNAAATTPAAARPSGPDLLLGDATVKGGEVLHYRFVVYNASAEPGAEATMKVDVLEGEKPVYEGAWQPLAARVTRRDARGVEAGGQLRTRLTTGLYTLRVTVKDAKSKKTVQQTADFEVEP